jgi:hypothetical protein
MDRRSKQLTLSVVILTLLCAIATPVLAQLPDAPSHSKAAFWITAATAGAVSLDAYTTLQFGAGQPCQVEANSPALYGTHPTSGRVSAVMGLEFVGATVAGHFMQKSHNRFLRRLWFVPQSVILSTHASGALHNARKC